MDLRSKLESVFAAVNPVPWRPCFVAVFFGQNRRAYLEWEPIMSLLFNRQTAVCSVKHYKESSTPTDRQILPACSRVTP